LKQPKVLINGVTHNVASVWWNEEGELLYITYYFEDTVETVFGSQEFYKTILIKEEENNEPFTAK
jgi:hypothetical protein